MKKLLFSFAALAAVAACTEESQVEPVPSPSETFTEVSFVANAQTKTHLDENYNVIWDADDAVALKFTSSSEVKIVNFTTAKGGESATFKANLAGDVTTSAGYDNNVFAVYPARAVDAVSGEIPVVLSTVVNGTIYSEMNLSSAVLSLDDLRAGTATANFLNAYAIIEFTLPENVMSVKISGTVPLSGTATMKFADASQRLVVKDWNGPSTAVTLKSSNGAVLEKDKVYNILVYPGAHTSMTVELTDSDGCTYSKTVSGDFKFEAAKYYTFNFNAAFTQEFSFTVSGVEVKDGSKILALFEDGETTHAKEAVVNGSSFTVQLPHGVEATSGYAVYPSDVYSEGKINFDLNPEVLNAVPFSWGVISMTDYTVTLAAAKLNTSVAFTVPAGVASYKITSNQPLFGPSVVTIGETGLNVAPTSEAIYTYEGNGNGQKQIAVYPQQSAIFSAVLYDANGASFNCPERTVVASLTEPGVYILPTSVDFSKSGSFTTEDFKTGGNYDF